MLVVVAVGGNALLQRGESPDAAVQEANVRIAVRSIAELAREHQVVITHGNGPQVGVLAVESEQDETLSRPYPLDVLGAETEGMIGYWLDRELRSELPGREVVTLLTQTVVDPSDAAFAVPTKFVGQVYEEAEARTHARDRGWVVRPDGASWRRVVPSPAPLQILELPVIRSLVDSGVVVICGGGGGIPVAVEGDRLVGVEAVVDKDLAAGLLAASLDADALLLLTDVNNIVVNYGTPNATPLRSTSVDMLRAMSLAAGSMGPKAAAAAAFVEATGKFAAIGALSDAIGVLNQTSGTRVYPSSIGTPDAAFAALHS